MNLHFKPIFWLVGGIIVAFAISLVFQIGRNTQLLQRLADENTALIEKSEWKNAENVFLATQNAVQGSLERGEMDKFTQVLKTQRNVKGLLEFSLFNPEGAKTFSSDVSLLKNPLPPEVAAILQAKPVRYKRLTAEAFEIYEPQIVGADCLRCHTTWTKDSSGGTLLCRFSTENLVEIKQSSAASLARMKTSQITSGVVITLLIAGFFVLLAVVVVSRQIVHPLGSVMKRLTESLDQVRSSSNQISVASQTLAEGASEQAASLEETSASLEELSAMTKRNAENAQEAKELAKHTRAIAESGTGAIQQMHEAMGEIKQASNNIAKIVKSIDEIAFQTNILALNAAVEAARAGESGAGFAVVADEVRSLAQRSATAARETAAKIEDSIVKSERGVLISQQVSQCFDEIKDKVHKMDDLVVSIASASKDQSDGISQVNTAVAQMDKVTQANAASSEQSAAAARELNHQEDALKNALMQMAKLMTGAQAAAALKPEATDAGSPPRPSPSLAYPPQTRSIEPFVDHNRRR